MADERSHTLEWMRRLDRRFSTLSDRFDQLEKRVARLEHGNNAIGRDVSDLNQVSYQVDKRLERLESRFEMVEPSDG